MSGRHAAARPRDVQGMTPPSRPGPRPAPPWTRWIPRAIIGSILAIILVAVIATAVETSNKKDYRGTAEHLCDLLGSGWTTSEIVHGDQWRDWDSQTSMLQREIAVTHAAETTCPELG